MTPERVTHEDRRETPTERADRNMGELLQELRVALPGVQVLFAFLFSVPFAARFDQVSPFEEKVYLATLLCAACASVMLIGPSAYHRLNFSRGDKAHIVAVANRMAIVGFVMLGLASSGAVLMVCSFVFGGVTAAVATAGVALLTAVIWFAIPLARRLRRG